MEWRGVAQTVFRPEMASDAVTQWLHGAMFTDGGLPMSVAELPVPLTNGRMTLPAVTITTITPAIAGEILRRNTRNRRVKPAWVAALTQRIQRGEWRLDWDAIALDRSGLLLNGQHRLMAIVRANVPCQCVLIEGLEPDVQEVGDTGVKRTVGDTLGMHNEKNGPELGAILAVLQAFEISGRPLKPNNYVLTGPAARSLLERHPDVRDAVPVASRFKRAIGRNSPATFGACYYLFTRVDPADAEAFAHGIITGEALEQGDPRLTLRNRFLVHASSQTTKLSTKVIATFIIRAWNAWRRGEAMTKFQFRASDPFPVIEGL